MSKSKIFIVLLVVVAVAVGLYFTVLSSDDEPANQANTEENADDESAGFAEETVTYKITYDATWSGESHPNTLPPGAHVSPAVLVVHSAEGTLYTPETVATDGIEQMAETGATDILLSELSSKEDIVITEVGTRIDVPGQNEFTIEVSQNASLLSFVSMLAPSPDWFIGIHDYELFDAESNEWIEEAVVELTPYDSGTDTGETFTAGDIDTQPRANIGAPVDQQFIEASSANPFGSLIIEMI